MAKIFARLKASISAAVAGWRKMKTNTDGAVAVFVAILFPVLVGGMGLGAEVSHWYFTQRKLQHAADTAAHAAGVRKRANDLKSELEMVALNNAARSGFIPSKDSKTGLIDNLILNNPPGTGPNVSQVNAVEIVLREKHPRLLSSIFSTEPVDIQARAVADLQDGKPACVVGLANTDPSMNGAVTVIGSAEVTLAECNASTNSNASSSFYLEGHGKLSADCAYTVGGADTGSGLDLACQENEGDVVTGAPPVLDPYKNVPWPPSATQYCQINNMTQPVQKTVVSAYGKIVDCYLPKLSGTVEFGPGGYIIKSGEKLWANAGAKIYSTGGVTFFFEGTAKLEIEGHAELNLSAPTDPENPYSGILFFGNSSTSAEGITHKMLGGSDSELTGAIYMPRSTVEYLGNSDVSGSCLQILADKVVFTGNTTISLGSNCEAAGTKPLLTGQVVRLVE